MPEYVLLLWIILPNCEVAGCPVEMLAPIELARYGLWGDCNAALDTVKASGPAIVFIATCEASDE